MRATGGDVPTAPNTLAENVVRGIVSYRLSYRAISISDYGYGHTVAHGYGADQMILSLPARTMEAAGLCTSFPVFLSFNAE